VAVVVQLAQPEQYQTPGGGRAHANQRSACGSPNHSHSRSKSADRGRSCVPTSRAKPVACGQRRQAARIIRLPFDLSSSSLRNYSLSPVRAWRPPARLPSRRRQLLARPRSGPGRAADSSFILALRATGILMIRHRRPPPHSLSITGHPQVDTARACQLIATWRPACTALCCLACYSGPCPQACHTFRCRPLQPQRTRADSVISLAHCHGPLGATLPLPCGQIQLTPKNSHL
jgi:hypothetical protein